MCINNIKLDANFPIALPSCCREYLTHWKCHV